MKTRRQYDRTGGPEEFKKKAVELSVAKGSLKANNESGITPQILTRWRPQQVAWHRPPCANEDIQRWATFRPLNTIKGNFNMLIKFSSSILLQVQ